MISDVVGAISQVKRTLHNLFKIKDLGEAKHFLSIAVARTDKGVHQTQRKYAFDLLKEYGFVLSKLVATPMETTLKLAHGNSEMRAENAAFRSVIGKLLYLTITRQDLSFEVKQLSH